MGFTDTITKLFATDKEVLRIEWQDNPKVINNYFVLINNKIVKVNEPKFRKIAKEHKLIEAKVIDSSTRATKKFSLLRKRGKHDQ